jgi:lysophospholipase L1-like esterase
MGASFDYENLNDRPPNVVSLALRRLLPGVGRVAAQTVPYAAWWRARNLEALTRADPLWVVLGDSMSQGIGASAVQHGWVPRTQAALTGQGVGVRVVNLSFSGARVGDVLERQLPALAALGVDPAVTTVLVGSNDLLRRSLRRGLVARYDVLLDHLPEGTLVATTPGDGRLGTVAGRVARHPRVVDLPLAFARGELAEDRFHPDDAAYARLSRTFAGPVAAALERAREGRVA